MADDVILNPGVGGDTIAADDVGGKKFQRMKLAIGDDGVNNGDVSAANPLPAILSAAASPSTIIGAIQGPPLTKGTQGSTGMSTQDLKDAGRVIVNASTVIAGVAGVAAEAMLALDVSRAGAAVASATSIAVTAAKKLRVIGVMVGFVSSAAAVVSVRASLRYNPAGAAIVTSPIILTAALSSAPAVIQQGNQIFIPLPEGIEFSGADQLGLSHVGSVATYTIWASLVAFEY